MKKLLLIIPLALSLAALGQGEKKSEMSKDADRTSKGEKNYGLDGRAFKITLMNRSATDEVKSSEKMQSDRTSVGTTKSTSTATTTTNDYNGTGNNTTGATTTGTTTTGNATTGSEVTGATTVTGSGTTTTGTVSGNPNNGTATGTTGATGTVNGTTSGTGAVSGTATTTTTTKDNTSITQDNTRVGDPVTGPAKSEDLVTNKKMILRFDDGKIRSNMLSTRGVDDCPYNVTSAAGNMTSFTSTCKNSSAPEVRAMWSGIVDGNNIRGNFTWTSEDGRTMTYTFSGTAATQKDIDASQELGLR